MTTGFFCTDQKKVPGIFMYVLNNINYNNKNKNLNQKMTHTNLTKWSMLSLVGIVLLSVSFMSCKKENLSPSLTSNAKPVTPPGGGGGNTAFNFINTNTAAFAGGCFDVISRLETSGGSLVNANAPHIKMSITVTAPDLSSETKNYDSDDLQANGGMTFTKNICNAQLGTYTIQICETHVANTGNTVQNTCVTIYVVVTPAENNEVVCPSTGASLTGSASIVALNDAGLPNGDIRSEFVVNVCAGSFAQLKLQGGLVAKATAPKYDNANNPDQSKPWAFITPDADGSLYDGVDANNALQVKATNQNWTITWLLNNVAAGYTKTYVIRYNKSFSPGANFVTGAWSLKNGSEVVGAYTDRLVINY
jgi:hypothetical protein